jgi:hypothetical protein
MLSFHGKEEIKQKYIDRVIAHQQADRLLKGATGKDNKGCAVACTLDMVYDHSRYPIELGIPEWLARVEDTLFEGMNLEKSKTWPELFLKAIPIGVDLEPVKWKFLCMVLRSTFDTFDHAMFPDVKKATDRVIAAWENDADPAEFEVAWAAALWAAWEARLATTWETTWAAAWEARSATTWATTWATADAAAWGARWATARGAAAQYDFFADGLLKILENREGAE